ncbi:(2Fe-2S)-binding protein [bacterium]|nr:(2Fe-2S)-binding protein [bacterium]
MAKVYFSKEKVSFEIDQPISVLSLALNNNIPVTHRCGSELKCSSCKFRVLEGEGAFSEPSTAEIRLLKKFDYPPIIRLACQAKIDPNFQGEIEVGTIIKTHNKQRRTFKSSQK